jgi:hypothetical protein
MGDTKKVKKKCCLKFEKKGKHCSSCPLTAEGGDKKQKKTEKSKEKEKKKGGKEKE